MVDQPFSLRRICYVSQLVCKCNCHHRLGYDVLLGAGCNSTVNASSHSITPFAEQAHYLYDNKVRVERLELPNGVTRAMTYERYLGKGKVHLIFATLEEAEKFARESELDETIEMNAYSGDKVYIGVLTRK